MPGGDIFLPTSDMLFENAACGLLVTDSVGEILRANATFCNWVGFAHLDIVQKRRLQDFLTMGGKVFHQTHWAPLLQMQGSIAEVKLDLVHRDGHTVPMMINAMRHPQGAQFLTYVALTVVTDRQKYERELLSARRKAEQALSERLHAERQLQLLNTQLSKADQRKDEFLATLAHELRNPLAPMRNVVEILRAKNYPDAELHWAQEVLDRQLDQMTHLVDDLLEISRITQDKLELRKEPLDLADAMLAAVESVGPLMRQFEHELIISLPPEPIRVEADPIRLTQMVLNLLNNAAKYTPTGGKIWLSAAREQAQAVLTIRDSGIGIATEHLASVFDMFSQLEPVLERSQGGLGVGLALVRGLAELHGGTVSASSAGLGQGSTFEIRLPLLESNAIGPAIAARPQFNKSTGQRILVVDDNPDAVSTLAKLLQLHGHQVEEAPDGETGLLRAHEFNPHIIFLDIGLPGMNGYEVARRIRDEAWGKSMRLVALTGWGQHDDKLAASAAGFDHHLTKPIDFVILNEILATV